MTALFCFLATPVLAPPASKAFPAPQPVVSQVYGGGGNIGATFQRDYVELFVRSGSTADLTGYSVQYAPATSANWVVTPLYGSLEIGQYLLVQLGSGGMAGGPLPTPDIFGTENIGVGAGKVALVSSFVPLVGACPAGPQIVDLVGYGATANCFRGTGPAPGGSVANSTSRLSNGCVNDNQNATDFASVAAAPRNAASARNLCAPIPGVPQPESTIPGSPGNVTTPLVRGTADPGTTVEIFTDPACSGAPVGVGASAAFGSTGIGVTVPANSTSTLYALAHDGVNTSGCSPAPVVYTEDSIPPDAPTLHASAPLSPSSDTEPRLLGNAEPGSTVAVFRDPACADPVSTGTAGEFNDPGIPVQVPQGSTTTFRAIATDQAGNSSGCSSSSLTYQARILKAPVVSDLRVTPRNFIANPNRVTPVISSTTRGTSFRLTLSEASSVRFAILRNPRRQQKPGRLGSPAHVFHRNLKQGASVVPFSGRLNGRVFPPGNYVLFAIATDQDGMRSSRAQAGFRVLRSPDQR